MPEVFDHFFRLVGTTTDAHLDLVRLDPAYRVFFEGQEDPLDVATDEEGNRRVFEEVASELTITVCLADPGSEDEG